MSSSVIKENDTRLNESHGPNQPIENLIDQVEDAVCCTVARKAPYDAQKIVNST